MWALIHLFICASVAQTIPSRQYDQFEYLATVSTPPLDKGFRWGEGVYFSQPDSGATGSASITMISEATMTRGSTASRFPFTLTQSFVQGWPWGGSSPTDALMVLNDRGKGYFGKFNSTYANITTSDTFENCTEDRPPICYGNVTVVVTALQAVVASTTTLVSGTMDQIFGGEVDWKNNRAYFIGVEQNFTIYVWDISGTFTFLFPIQGSSVGDTTGFVTQSELNGDGSILYLLTSANNFYRVLYLNTSFPVVELIMKFTAYDPLDFTVSDTWQEALVTCSGSPTYLLWVDLDQRRVYETYTLNTLFSPQVVLQDSAAGFAFVVGFNAPSLVVRVNLETHSVDLAPFSLRDSGRAANGFLDLTTAKMYVAGQKDVSIARYPGACPDNCNGKGVCTFGGICACIEGFAGDACDTLACPKGFDAQICSGNGVCNNGTCACFPGYSGVDCDGYTCNGDCSGHGTCNVDSHVCTCDPGWSGGDCSNSLLTLCESSSCAACSRKTQCVWCESNNTCILGDENGPLLQFCPLWHFRNCNWEAFRVMGYILLAVVFLFLLLNFICRVREDSYGGAVMASKTNVVRTLWIGQRSFQTWIMIEQLQLTALIGYILPPLPTSLKAFTDAISVFLISSKPAWIPSHIPQVPWRTTQNFLQIGITVGANPMDLMAGTFFIFLLIIGGVIIYTIGAFISKNEMAIWRSTHILLRVFQFSQIGLCALGAWTVTQVGKSYGDAQSYNFSIVAAFISIFFFGLIYPLAALILVVVKKKYLFRPNYRVQFGSLYEVYHHDKLWFGAFHLFRNSTIALFVGFFADSATGFFAPVMTTIMPLLILVISLICTIVARPFADKVRGLIQSIMLSVFDILIFGLAIVYVNYLPSDGWAVAICAICSGSVFFTLLVWLMNHVRIGPVNKNITTDDASSAYVRM